MATGIAVSLGLFWLGEGRQWRYGRCYDRESANLDKREWLISETDPIRKMTLILDKCGAAPSAANPFVGLIAPLVVLGGCAFVAAGAHSD